MRNSWQTAYPTHASKRREGEFLIASEFEYRHRFAIMAFVFIMHAPLSVAFGASYARSCIMNGQSNGLTVDVIRMVPEWSSER